MAFEPRRRDGLTASALAAHRRKAQASAPYGRRAFEIEKDMRQAGEDAVRVLCPELASNEDHDAQQRRQAPATPSCKPSAVTLALERRRAERRRS